MVLLNELLPESSTTHDHNHTYDVFLSFRGVDTRKRFTDHLYNALSYAGIKTFLDDEEIDTGEPLKPELDNAIKSSRASVIVLSKNYASSTWCLDELVLILEQKKNFNQIVPIFYDVEPTDVRKQQNSFGEAMAKHTKRMEEETDVVKRNQLAQKMESWRRALTEVANLKGIDGKDRYETELIEDVIAEIQCRIAAPLSNTLLPLVGRNNHIQTITSWLIDGSYRTIDILTVVGIGGIGKTSLAKYVFQLHSSKFHKSSFIESVNTRCTENFNGLHDLQKQLHRVISKNIKLRANDVSKKVFIVLDDIASVDQLDNLLGNKGLHPGSKIIITTKDASLTKRCALFISQVQPIHTTVILDGLGDDYSLELLCNHAFKCNGSIMEGYEDVSKELVKYCEGHPLALEVFGRALRNREVVYWENWIKMLKKEPHFDIIKALKMSFDSLPFENDKELFKHIACFFVGVDRDDTEIILSACDINTGSGINNLIDKCLLSITCTNKLMMHQLIREMGRYLVHQESPLNPWNRSRLWRHEESFKVLKQKKATENLLGIALDMRMLEKKKFLRSFELKTESFSQMDNLMLLQLDYVPLSGCFGNFLEELRWLRMHGSTLKSLSLDSPMENLVALDMSRSNIESFDMSYGDPQPHTKRQKLVGSCSKDKRLLGSLKILDLSFCEQLHSVSGFSELPALERLIVKHCKSLVEVCESIDECLELLHIDLSYCYMLKKIPQSLGKLKNVRTILLDGCNLRETQMEACDMNSLGNTNSSYAIVEAIPNALKFSMIWLPSSLVRLSLKNNNLCNASFPVDWSRLSMLKELILDENPIDSMPNCVRTLPRIQRLYMDACDKLVSIENPPHTLRILSIEKYPDCTTGSLRKIKFDPEMCPLHINTLLHHELYLQSSFEIDGMLKIQHMANVDEKILESLGWTNLEFIMKRRLNMLHYAYGYSSLSSIQTQMYYEFGIFSTVYAEKEIPNWISYRSEGPSISLTIPSSPNKLRGLNFCCVLTALGDVSSSSSSSSSYSLGDVYDGLRLPLIKISNITQNHTWIYSHYNHTGISSEKDALCFLSHWMFGPNEMKDGDQITITLHHSREVERNYEYECGIGLVYDEDGKIEEEEEDTLEYYKSWNHIIGKDLSAFQITTGEYLLRTGNWNVTNIYRFEGVIDEKTDYKGLEQRPFKAFS